MERAKLEWGWGGRKGNISKRKREFNTVQTRRRKTAVSGYGVLCVCPKHSTLETHQCVR